MERHIYHAMLRLGGLLLQGYFDMCSQQQPCQRAVNPDGQTLPYHSQRKRDYHSIFGELTLTRPYFYTAGQAGYCPLDAELGLGEDCYSDFLREMHERVAVSVPYEKVSTLLAYLLDINLSTRCVQKFMETDAQDVEAYYDSKPAPPVGEEASILVVQSDGKGVPIVKPSAKQGQARLKRGEARSRKKAVTVTAVYTLEPAPRAVVDVVNSLMKVEESPVDLNRSRPQGKHIWGTLAGKAVALDRLQQQVERRLGDHIVQGLILCDGDPSLQAQRLSTYQFRCHRPTNALEDGKRVGGLILP